MAMTMTGVNSTRVRTKPGDEPLPGFDELMYRPVPGPVAALNETHGSTIESVFPIQASWRPGKQHTMGFRVQGGDGPLAGEQRSRRLRRLSPQEARRRRCPRRSGGWATGWWPATESHVGPIDVTLLVGEGGQFVSAGNR